MVPNLVRVSISDGILFTDHYQLTMAQLYWRMGLAERRAQFDHSFRSYPDYGGHQAGYCIAAGLGPMLDWMTAARFGSDEVEVLRAMRSTAGDQLFADDFLSHLLDLGGFADVDLWAVPEGRVVHPDTPITVVQAPLLVAQLLETGLLHHLNFPTLIATKAARVAEAAHGGAVLEFGMRRAQNANPATRAAYIGGSTGSSNVGMSAVLGMQSKGTHAHSMVQVFMAVAGGELEAFKAYAEVYPDETLLLVDTIDTLESGVPNAIRVFEDLRAKGHRPVGIRLDSGDLAYLSIHAAKMLNDAGFPDTSIVLSNDLDELVIWQILTQINQEAERFGVDPEHLRRRLVYGVGTRLITSQGASSLGGVYKLVAVCDNEVWIPAIKISENPDKTPTPGHKNVWRLYDERGHATADLLSLDDEDPHHMEQIVLQHVSDHTKQRTLNRAEIKEIEPLLVDVWDKGQLVYNSPSLAAIRERRQQDMERLDAGVRRIINPHIYHVSLSQRLWERKQQLIASTRNNA